jgi:hypothetical protein
MTFLNKPGRVVSTEFKPVMLTARLQIPAAVKASGVLDQTGSSGGKLTFTADSYGTVGNDISVVLTDGGTAGSETVAVSGSTITVTIESGVSTSANIKTALDGDTDAAALISVVDNTTAAITAATDVTTDLSSGAGDPVIVSGGRWISSILPTTADGQYSLVLDNKWPDALGFFASINASDASTSSTVAKVELMNADAFAADVLAGNALELHMIGFDGAEEVVAAENYLDLMVLVSESTRN